MEIWDDLWFKSPEDIFGRAIPVLQKAGFSKKDYEDLHNRFLPNGCRQQFADRDIWAILCLVAEGEFAIDRKEPYVATPAARKILVPTKSYNESPCHHALKQDATEWLRKIKKVKKVLYEEPFGAGVSDVMSVDRHLIVECGASRPSKRWEYFILEDTDKDALIVLIDHGVTTFTIGPKTEE